MTQRVVILVGPSDGRKIDQVLTELTQHNWRVSVDYTAEDDGEQRMFDHTPLAEVTTLDKRGYWRERWLTSTLADVQAQTLCQAWRTYGGMVSDDESRSYFRGGTQFQQIWRVMQARGLRFVDAAPEGDIYDRKRWKHEFGLHGSYAYALEANQVLNPFVLQHLSWLDSEYASLRGLGSDTGFAEVRALRQRLLKA